MLRGPSLPHWHPIRAIKPLSILLTVTLPSTKCSGSKLPASWLLCRSAGSAVSFSACSGDDEKVRKSIACDSKESDTMNMRAARVCDQQDIRNEDHERS